MSKGLGILILAALWLNGYAGNGFRVQGAEAAALGGSSLGVSGPCSMANNPGAAAFAPNASLALSYRSPWFPEGAPDLFIAAALPAGRGVFGGSVSYKGNSLYYESRAAIGYGLRLGERFGLGVQVDYLHNRAAGHKGRHYCTFDIGILYKPTERVSIGMHIYNPVRYKVSERTGELLPIVFRTGVRYQPHERIALAAELEKDIVHPFNFRAGIAYSISEVFSLRGGFSTVPVIATFGFGYTLLDRLQIDIAGGYHLDLGFNTSASVSINFIKTPAENPVERFE